MVPKVCVKRDEIMLLWILYPTCRAYKPQTKLKIAIFQQSGFHKTGLPAWQQKNSPIKDKVSRKAEQLG